jgi:nucleotide-binding universal stress UspA family protein
VAAAIVDAASERHAELIVMSTHGRGGLGRWLWGSVADQVLRRANVPLLLVPATCERAWTADRPRRILVPLDGSALSEAIVPFVERIAGPLDSEVILLTVVPLPVAATVGAGGILPPEELTARESEALGQLSPLRTRLESKGLRVRTLATVGEAADGICRIAGQEVADLIAMSTHGRGGLGRLMFGSVALEVLRQSVLPVLMIRAAAFGVAA